MARTTPLLVQGILLNSYDSRRTPSLLPFIAVANELTTEVATKAAAKGVNHSSTRLELIERYLAAHQYTVSDRRFTEQRTFDGSKAIFESTSFLDAAKALDTSGSLALILSPKKATLLWLGKPPSEAILYSERD